MKKTINLILISLFILPTFILSADKKQNKESDEWKNRKFTIEELKKYNGKDGNPVYVAVDGIVYDVSKSKYWKTGTHKNLHQAGNDLTKEIKEDAPKFHKKGKILNKFPKVGVLVIEKSTDSTKNEVKLEENQINNEKKNKI